MFSAEKMKMPIDESIIQQFRSPAEYLQWFDQILNHIELESDREKVLLHKKPYKKIHEEIFPLARLLKNKTSTWSQDRFCNVLGSQKYDVEIKSVNCPYAYFEITCASFDDGEAFRMQKLLKHGTVSGTGELIRNGKPMKSGGRKVSEIASSLPRNHNDAVDEVAFMVKDKIKKKSKKEYPINTGLIVYYDDCSHQFCGRDYEKISSVCQGLESIWRTTFNALFAVGESGKLIEIKQQNNGIHNVPEKAAEID